MRRMYPDDEGYYRMVLDIAPDAPLPDELVGAHNEVFELYRHTGGSRLPPVLRVVVVLEVNRMRNAAPVPEPPIEIEKPAAMPAPEADIVWTNCPVDRTVMVMLHGNGEYGVFKDFDGEMVVVEVLGTGEQAALKPRYVRLLTEAEEAELAGV